MFPKCLADMRFTILKLTKTYFPTNIKSILIQQTVKYTKNKSKLSLNF